MFERLEKDGRDVTFVFDGKPYAAREGDTVAAALIAAGVAAFRNTPVSGSLRGPFCMMGTCYDCLVEIGGENVQACQVMVEHGLVVVPHKTPGENG